jgi:hypothetical protein
MHADSLACLGVSYSGAIADINGTVVIRTKGWASWDHAVDVVSWISRVLEREDDVASQLDKHGGPQRHAFIWATIGSAYAVAAEDATSSSRSIDPPTGDRRRAARGRLGTVQLRRRPTRATW